MADLFSELKRIKAQLKGQSKAPVEQPSPTQIGPAPSLPQVTPLRQRQNAAFDMVSRSGDGRAASSPSRGPTVVHEYTPAPSPMRQSPSAPVRTTSAEVRSPPTISPRSTDGRVSAKTSAAAPPSVRPHDSAPRVPVRASAVRTEPVPKTFQPLSRGALTRQGLFRQPEAWLPAGGKTQCVDSGYSGGVDVVIGLDFGTSFTKAAVGFRDKIFPVTWDGISKCQPTYLLPSEYTELDDGSLFIGQHPDARNDQVRGDLKLPFINAGVSGANVCAASTFVALVLRYIRAWVFHHHAAKLGRARIRWQFNIGAPCNGLENLQLVRVYKVLAATAWLRSLEVAPLRLAGDSSTLWRDDQPLLDLIEHQVLPEFVAQMAGYMQSPQRQRGLHALVDVGGGTLDVVTFNVHQVEGEDTFPFLVPQVHSFGTHGLIQNRLTGLMAVGREFVVDELAPIESARAFARSAGIAEHHVSNRDALFKTELRSVIKSVFETTKSRRYRLSEAWRTGVRTFFTGGGSQLDLYRDALKTSQVPSAKGLHLMLLPPHRNLDGFSGGDREYQRVSVACGLAQDALTLGRIVPAREVEDDPAVDLSYRERQPDSEELYSKR